MNPQSTSSGIQVRTSIQSGTTCYQLCDQEVDQYLGGNQEFRNACYSECEEYGYIVNSVYGPNYYNPQG